MNPEAQRNELNSILPDIPTVLTLQRESVKSLKGPCPFCGGVDRFVYREDTGKWHCRGCHPEQSDKIEFYEIKEGTDFAGLIKKYIGTGEDKIFDYLSGKRGIIRATIQQAIGAGITWSQEYKGKPAVAFLYQSLEGNHNHKRTIQYIAIDGKPFPNTDKNKLFKNGSKPADDFFITGKPLKEASIIVLLEACINALSIADAMPDVASIALGGSTMFRKAEKLKDLNKKIVCFFDNDKAGQQAAANVAAKVGGCYTVQWPDNLPAKYDANDLLKAGKKELIRAMIDNAVEIGAGKPESRIRACNIVDFLSLEIPPREYVIEPILPTQGLCMIYGTRGVGKTYLFLTIGLAVATGQKALQWTSPKARKVVYIDGEMPAGTMQERIAHILPNFGDEIDPDYFQIITPDLQQDIFVNLSRVEDQESIEPIIEDADLIIIDNLATLARCGRENDSESWLPVQEYLLKRRRRGKSVIMAHHAGKGGQQRGTSSKEDILDTVICLKRPNDYQQQEGARFEVILEKARGISGDAAKSFEAHLQQKDEKLLWVVKDLEDIRIQQAAELKEAGLTLREIADELHIGKTTVHRLLKKVE